MTVMKKKDMDWKSYLRELAESSTRISDIERTEFAGHLLRRDLQSTNTPGVLFDNIMSHDNYSFADVMASMLVTESPDSVTDLVAGVKNIVTDYYNKEIDYLVSEEEKVVEEEKSAERMKENPNL